MRWVIRSGSWYFSHDVARAAYRFRLHPVDRGDDLGVRVARSERKSRIQTVRGGSWLYDQSFARAAYRGGVRSGGKINHLGVRLAQSRKQT